MSGTRVHADRPSEPTADRSSTNGDTTILLRHMKPSVRSAAAPDGGQEKPRDPQEKPRDPPARDPLEKPRDPPARDPPEKPRDPPGARLYDTYVLPCVAEYVGMTLFIFIISLVTGNFSTAGPSWLVGVALTNGFAIVALVVAIGPVSGAHLNPAVTMAITLSGGLQPVLGVPYVIAQLTGSITGAHLTKAILPNTTYALCLGGANSVGPGVTAGGAILCEVLVTSFLVLVILMCGVDPEYKQQPLPPLAIGLAVVVGILCGGPYSGGSMNPARSFGPAVASGVWDYHYVWWVGPIIGGLLSAGIYRLLLASEDRRLLTKSVCGRRSGRRDITRT